MHAMAAANSLSAKEIRRSEKILIIIHGILPMMMLVLLLLRLMMMKTITLYIRMFCKCHVPYDTAYRFIVMSASVRQHFLFPVYFAIENKNKQTMSQRNKTKIIS